MQGNLQSIHLFETILHICFIINDNEPLHGCVHSYGVCYGTVADDLPPPSEVVQLYKSNGISNMRVYFPDIKVMEASSSASPTRTSTTWPRARRARRRGSRPTSGPTTRT